jgi:CubicO group peptidase (beta-lactamase class C family)
MLEMQRRSLLAAGAYLGLGAAAGLHTPAAASITDGPEHGAAPALDRSALQVLSRRSQETKSDAVLLYHRGQKVFEYYAGKPAPIFLMSCVKSIASLAVGRAIADGKIKGLDPPVSDFYPEMKQGRKAAMTIRHLLTMTSGIQNTGTGMEVYAAPDIVRLALAAELTTAPGAAFDYNNKSVNLLSGIIHVATKQPLDDYVRDQFFQPMDINSWNWGRDDDGNASAMADLALYPEDFAKFGLLMQQGGMWKGKPLVPASWVKQSAEQSQPYEPLYGLLWWRIPGSSTGVLTAKRIADLAKAGLRPNFAAALKHLEGKTFASEFEWHHALQAALPSWEAEAPKNAGVADYYASDIPIWRHSGFDGFQAEGSLGQYLVVFPERGLVGVRMIKGFDGYTFNQNRFEDFANVVRTVAPAG